MWRTREDQRMHCYHVVEPEGYVAMFCTSANTAPSELPEGVQELTVMDGGYDRRPSWLNSYPGSRITPGLWLLTRERIIGVWNFETTDSPQLVREFHSRLVSAAGLAAHDAPLKEDAKVILEAGDRSGPRFFELRIATPSRTVTRARLSYSLQR